MSEINQPMGSQPSNGQMPSNRSSKFNFKKINKNHILLAIAVVAILVTGILVSVKSGNSNVLSFLQFTPSMSTDAVAKKTVDYLNKSVLQQGQVATLVSSSEQSGVVKITIKIADKTYDSYATKDGKLIFPEAFTVSPAAAASTTNTTTTPQTATNVPKVATTSLQAFVVSNCPFGLQMQRAMVNAIKTVPALAQYMTVRYIGAVSGNTITSMHGVEEAQENLRQICIRDEQPTKYWNYVGCYMEKSTGTASNGMPYGNSTTCQASTGIDTAKLNACVADPARGLADAKADFALDTKYNVSGSPTLILNGATIDETSFGGRSADAMRNIICSSSTTAPAFCSTKLDTTPATTSFSLTYAGATGSATAAANTNCAPATN